MPLADLPLALPFIFFLLLFVVIGIYPTWKKTANMLRAAMRDRPQKETTSSQQETNDLADFFVEQHFAAQLNDFELFILRRMAQDPSKTLSSRQLNSDLHLEKPMLKTALESLQQRGLVLLSFKLLSGVGFSLSPRGREQATVLGYIADIRQN